MALKPLTLWEKLWSRIGAFCCIIFLRACRLVALVFLCVCASACQHRLIPSPSGRLCSCPAVLETLAAPPGGDLWWQPPGGPAREDPVREMFGAISGRTILVSLNMFPSLAGDVFTHVALCHCFCGLWPVVQLLVVQHPNSLWSCSLVRCRAWSQPLLEA